MTNKTIFIIIIIIIIAIYYYYYYVRKYYAMIEQDNLWLPTSSQYASSVADISTTAAIFSNLNNAQTVCSGDPNCQSIWSRDGASIGKTGTTIYQLSTTPYTTTATSAGGGTTYTYYKVNF